jgi:hypothetical protein
MIDRIEQIIEKENLLTRSRKRSIVHRRWFLFGILRKHGIKLKKIGEMFDLNHSTIIYGMSIAEFFEKQNDELYLLDTMDLQKEFSGIEIIFQKRNLINDINNCKSMNELSIIQCRLKNNQYLNYNNLNN